MPDTVPVVLEDLPTSIHGFVCLGSDYEPIIVINSRLSVEVQRKAFLHEMQHLLSGQFDDDGYDYCTEYGDPA